MLAIPLAWDEHRAIVWPDDADKNADYWCPECLEVVHLRGGPKVRSHFYHIHSGICTGEGARHAAAKHWLVDMVKRGVPLNFHYWCPRCLHDASYPLPPQVVNAEAEVTSGNFRVDVGLLDAHGTLLAAVEVWDHHRVDETKAATLSVPWGEITAERVLYHPDDLRMQRVGGGWREPKTCKACRRSWVPMDLNGQSSRTGYKSTDEGWYRQRFRLPSDYAMLGPGDFIGADIGCPRYRKIVTARYCQQCTYHDSFHITDYPDEESELLADYEQYDPAEHSHVHCRYFGRED